ncbi:MAG: anaerobic ribonucleoside-triphosphate reductase activating protein [Phycisphaerae bacterium]|jgi:pyruvate formate lyase activating enzyme
MNIGGLQPFSLNDFPGRVAAVIFTQGCNFCCPFCHNGQLVSSNGVPDEQLSDGDVLRFLRNRRRQIDGVVLSGGEPTLQPDLPDFLCQLRRLGYAIKIDTNGSRPDVIRRLIAAEFVDFIAMDVKAPLERYDVLSGTRVNTAEILESIQLISASTIAHQFRTTVVPSLLHAADIARIRRLLPENEELRLQTFQPEHARDPALRQQAAANQSHAALAG